MIEISFKLDDDTDITKVKMHHTPVKGDYIWLLPADNRQSAYMVTAVAHWVSDAPHFREGYHHACVYVEPV